MKTWDDLKDRLVGRRDLEGRNMDGARNEELFIKWKQRLIVRRRDSGVVCRVCVEDDVLEWLDSRPRGVDWPLSVWLRK